MNAMSGDALTWLVGPRIQRRFGVLLNVLGRVVLQSSPEPFVAQVEAILSTPDEMREELVNITAPTLIITGSQDALTPLGDAEELAELIADSRLVVVSGAAHGVMAEAPNAFNDTVLRFLDEIDQTRQDDVAASA
jgi:3-oxoadipate enol-lactonase